jgi:hypothetical protein
MSLHSLESCDLLMPDSPMLGPNHLHRGLTRRRSRPPGSPRAAPSPTVALPKRREVTALSQFGNAQLQWAGERAASLAGPASGYEILALDLRRGSNQRTDPKRTSHWFFSPSGRSSRVRQADGSAGVGDQSDLFSVRHALRPADTTCHVQPYPSISPIDLLISHRSLPPDKNGRPNLPLRLSR